MIRQLIPFVKPIKTDSSNFEDYYCAFSTVKWGWDGMGEVQIVSEEAILNRWWHAQWPSLERRWVYWIDNINDTLNDPINKHVAELRWRTDDKYFIGVTRTEVPSHLDLSLWRRYWLRSTWYVVGAQKMTNPYLVIHYILRWSVIRSKWWLGNKCRVDKLIIGIFYVVNIHVAFHCKTMNQFTAKRIAWGDRERRRIKSV